MLLLFWRLLFLLFRRLLILLLLLLLLNLFIFYLEFLGYLLLLFLNLLLMLGISLLSFFNNTHHNWIRYGEIPVLREYSAQRLLLLVSVTSWCLILARCRILIIFTFIFLIILILNVEHVLYDLLHDLVLFFNMPIISYHRMLLPCISMTSVCLSFWISAILTFGNIISK